ncbi:hypothetical protein Tco_0585150 [Tanacetum coccineum]
MITELQVIDSPDESISSSQSKYQFRLLILYGRYFCIFPLDRQGICYQLYREIKKIREIIRWGFYESSGVHTLELEDGTMIHMLAERRYPLSRELMIRMLDHGMEVEDENETAITLIHLFILWTTEDGGNS